MRIAGIVPESIVDGPGLRFSVFTQGCALGCPGCQNPQTHDPDGGREIPVEIIAAQLAAAPLISGLSLSGGEPMEQAADCLTLARAAQLRGLTVWCWTGHELEALLSYGTPAQRALLRELDVLVDGPFRVAERSLSLSWRGSANQRVLDVPASLSAGHAVLWEPPAW